MPDDFRSGNARRVRYFTLYGGAALLGAHFLVSWGTNLGFLAGDGPADVAVVGRR
jgi:hypothetical protein